MNGHTNKKFPIRFGIRLRLLLALILTMAIPAALFLRISINQIFNGISTIENANLESSLNQTLTALRREMDQIEANVQDYAHWDEMYDPATGKDPEWLRVNITIWIPQQFDIDVIWAADRDGNVYYQYNTPKEFQNNVASHPLFKSGLRGDANSHAIINTSNGPMMAASSFISPAYFGAPFDPTSDASGVLFYGRYIGSDLAQRISTVTGLNTDFYDSKTLIATSNADREHMIGLPLTEDKDEVLSIFSNLRSAHFEYPNEHAIFAPLYDVNNQPILAVAVRHQMAVERLVRENLERMLIWGLAASLAVSLLLIVLLGTRVTRAIRNLSSSIKSYTEGDIHHPIAVTRTDELGELQSRFADLMAKLNQAKVRIHEQEITILDLIGTEDRAMPKQRIPPVSPAARKPKPKKTA